MTDEIPAWVNGTLTALDKLEVHRRGLKHPAVSVFVMQGGQTLLQRRAMGKYHTPGLWTNACCTHPMWNEPPADCAARRLRQEMGISGLPLHWLARTEYRAEVGPGLTEHEVVDIFAAAAPPGLQPRPDPAEVMEARWSGLHELQASVQAEPDLYTPWLRIYLASDWFRALAAPAG